MTFAWITWEVSRDPLSLGYLGLAQGVPLVLFQLFGGVLADRIDRLRMLIVTQILTAGTLTIAFALTMSGVVRLDHLLVLAALTNTFRAFDEPSRMALVPQLVERDRLANAIALGSIPWQAGRMIGPSITGILIAAFGGAIGFGLAALASYTALALYSRLRLRGTASAGTGQRVLAQFVEGLSFVGHNFVFSCLIALALFNSLFAMSYLTLLPIFADAYFHAGSTGYGLLNAAHGTGALQARDQLPLRLVARGLLRAPADCARRPDGSGRDAPPRMDRHAPRLLKGEPMRFMQYPARVAALLVGAACVGGLLIVFSFSPGMGLALPVLVLVGFCNTFYLMQVSTFLQQKVPDHLRGRVMSLYSLCWNLLPLGGLLAGALAAAVDARFAVLFGGAMVAANALLLLASRRLRVIS